MRWVGVSAVVLALALVVGESVRSAGAHRPWWDQADDWTAGALLLAAAWLSGQRGEPSRRAVAAVWGLVVGGLLTSFVLKLVAPGHMQAGTLSPALLTALVGVALIFALVNLSVTILLPSQEFRP